jgi:hypothetical protein
MIVQERYEYLERRTRAQRSVFIRRPHRLAFPVVCSSKPSAGLHLVAPDAATPARVTARWVDELAIAFDEVAVFMVKSLLPYSPDKRLGACAVASRQTEVSVGPAFLAILRELWPPYASAGPSLK